MPSVRPTGTPLAPLAAILALLAPSQVGCFAGAALQGFPDRPVGTVDLVSGTLGSHTLVPAACVSGERQLFLGADFVDDRQGLTLRLVLDPTGSATIRVFRSSNPLDRGVLFQRQDCSRLELSLERTGWSIDDIYDLRVDVDLDCRRASGDALQGKLAVEHCH